MWPHIAAMRSYDTRFVPAWFRQHTFLACIWILWCIGIRLHGAAPRWYETDVDPCVLDTYVPVSCTDLGHINIIFNRQMCNNEATWEVSYEFMSDHRPCREILDGVTLQSGTPVPDRFVSSRFDWQDGLVTWWWSVCPSCVQNLSALSKLLPIH